MDERVYRWMKGLVRFLRLRVDGVGVVRWMSDVLE